MDDIDAAVSMLIEAHDVFAKAVKKDPSRRAVIRRWVEAFVDTNGRLPNENEMNPSPVMWRIEGAKWPDDLFKPEHQGSAEVLFRMAISKAGNREYSSGEGAATLAKVISAMPPDAKIIDVGTAGSEFISSVISATKDAAGLHLVTTNYFVPAEYQPNPRVRKDEMVPFYDVISNTPKLDVGNAHVVIVKDVLKFYPHTWKRAWDRLVSEMQHGAVLVTGDMQTPEGGRAPPNKEHEFGGMRMRFHVILEEAGKKKAVEVSPRKFAAELAKLGSHTEYRGQLPKIVRKTELRKA